jgi:hypothetical protein
VTTRTREELVETVASAFRPRDATGGVRPHPKWFDLDERGRAAAFDVALSLRALEAAMDPDGLSTTAHAVVQAIKAGHRAGG